MLYFNSPSFFIIHYISLFKFAKLDKTESSKYNIALSRPIRGFNFCLEFRVR